MAMSESRNESSSHERTRGYAQRGTALQPATWLSAASAVLWGAGIAVLVAVGLVSFVAGMIYLNSLVGPAQLGQLNRSPAAPHTAGQF